MSAHKVVIRGSDKSTGGHSYGVAVEIDGKPMRGIRRVSVDLDQDEFAVVSLTFSAEVEAGLELSTLAVIDPADEREIAQKSADAVKRIAQTAARRNYLQVRGEPVEV